jgi:hypothetical protein
MLIKLSCLARGTSEPGQLGQVVGDPVVARVKRDLPGVDVRGYPVQVRIKLPFHRCIADRLDSILLP